MRFVAWVWFGMIIGVSFIATPAKFLAESLTLPVALEVGRVTFRIFDRLEWVILAILLVIAWRRWRASQLDRTSQVSIAMVVVAVILHSAYFLPALDHRVALVIAGEPLPPSPLHTISGAFEVLQALSLCILGARASAVPASPASGLDGGAAESGR